jgi:hypothetical protein
MPARTLARHRAERRFHVNARSLIATTCAIGAGTLAAVLLSGGTYALWSDASTQNAPTLSSAKFGITAAESWGSTAFSNLIVGQSVRQPFTVTNTGDVAATISGTATASAAYEIRYATGTCTTAGTAALTGTSATTTAKALGTLAAGATATYCIEVKVAAGAAAGNSQAITATITGAQ